MVFWYLYATELVDLLVDDDNNIDNDDDPIYFNIENDEFMK